MPSSHPWVSSGRRAQKLHADDGKQCHDFWPKCPAVICLKTSNLIPCEKYEEEKNYLYFH